MSLQNLLPQWLQQLDTIAKEVQSLLGDRYILRETMEIVRANPDTHKPNDFVEWFLRQYSVAASAAVRRQVDRRRDTVSLIRLLEDLARSASSITRAWFVGSYPEEMRRDGIPDEAFDRWSGAEGGHVDPTRLRQHCDRLTVVCSPLKEYVDKRIAHRSQEGEDSLPKAKWDELNRAIDTLDQIICELILLLRQASTIGGLQPVWQYKWQNVFEIPWKPSMRRTRKRAEQTGQ